MKQWLTAFIWHKLTIITLLISFPLYCTQNIYYIKPTIDTQCPGEPCHTLHQCIEQTFSSNATLVFLPGDHALNFTISVGNPIDFWNDSYAYQSDSYKSSSSLTLLGSPSSLPEISSRIICTWPAGFHFSGIAELHITALAFISCGHNGSAAVNILSVWNINISKCIFKNNTNKRSGSNEYGFGGAIHVHSSNFTLTENTFQHNFAYYGGALEVFTNNTVTLSRNIFHNNSADYGGALYATTNNTLTLSENTFQGNSADKNGGAVLAQRNNFLTISGNTFQDNTADYGGALYATTNNTLTLSENTFLDNSANENGGALNANVGNTLTLPVNLFQGNSADKGGGLYAYINNTLTLSENTFLNNSADFGGAVMTLTNNVITISENKFQYNSADYGGALHTNVNNTLTLSENIFRENSADYGGAVYAYTNNTIALSENTFQSNCADQFGGALGAHIGNIFTLSENTFEDNSADYGGVLYANMNNTFNPSENTFHDNSANYGGAVYANANNTLILSENTFQGNSADNNGGAVLAYRNNFLTISGNTFQDNSADFGGALYATTNNTLTLSENTFLDNSADKNGGALNAKIGNTLTLPENVFQGNSADKGGGLYAYINNTLTLSENTLLNNTADFGGAVLTLTNNVITISENKFQYNSADYGGALHAEENNTLTLSENTFRENSANYEGAVYALTNNTIALSGNTFQSNSADQFGGALGAQIGNTFTLSENTFQDNSAVYGGALYAYANNTFNLSENTFHENSADYGGAVYAYGNNMLTLSENTFQNNSADYGGALHAEENNTLTLSENTFRENSANYEGAVYALTNNTIALSGNTFQSNSADQFGGALGAQIGNTFTLSENTFQDNSAVYGGALYAYANNTFNLSENTFHENSADYGGAVYAYGNNMLTLSENTFQNNSADYGGALHINVNNTLTLSENIFQHSSALHGGAIYAYGNNTLTLSENTFQSNTADRFGGAVIAQTNNAFTFSRNVLYNNTAAVGGAFYPYEYNNVTLSENTFQNNSADRHGGVLYAFTNNILTLTENTFRDNSANIDGGALVVRQSTINLTNNILTGNTAESNGGAIFCLSNSTLQVYGSHRLQNNTAQRGGAVAALGCKIVMAGDMILENNTASYGGGLYAEQSEVRGYAYFSKNSAHTSGGGIYASRSDLYFEQCIVFDGNVALNGGGLLLAEYSKFYLLPNTTINFTNNFVQKNGGAIEVASNNPLSYCVEASCEFLIGSDCFFQIQTERQYNFTINVTEIPELHNVRMYFHNNTALEAGAMLYGGSVDDCSLSLINPQLVDHFQLYTCPNSGEVYNYITSFDEQSQNISSDPLYICSCEGGEPDCSASSITRSVYPGGTIEVAIIAYGQRNGTTPAVILNITPRNGIRVKDNENTRNISKGCTSLNYTVQTLVVTEGSNYEMTLHVGPCSPKERTVSSGPTNVIKVHALILQCPPGFELTKIEPWPVCNCALRLKRYTKTCRIDDRDIYRESRSEFWVGYTPDNTSDGLILHPHCPFDYCTSNELYVAVANSDEQCSNNRTGLLCGKCAQNFSLALGTNRCLQCSDDYLWLIVAFALAGVALVLLLLVLRLTVAVGTINGLILYANIFAMNSETFFSSHTNILTVFISWLNLDLGIETCFYDGMDAYAKTWLQFAFPFYVWALVGIIILISHYSSKVATIFGTNPTAVLATLFLLSYTKFLRTIFAALFYTVLEYPNNTRIAVWLYDANITYLSNKHVPLFTTAVVCLIILFLPYTLFLIFSQWLRSKSGQCRIFSWVNNYRVLPFLEAYHAPYTDKHCYWTGLMLLVRCMLLLLFAFNALGNPSVNLLAIGCVTALLGIVYALLGNRIYKTWYLNTLELSFIVNLSILALATLYIRSTGGNQNAVTYTSISVAFATFIGIVIYHSAQQIKNTPQLCRRMFPRNNSYERFPQNLDLENTAPPSPPDPSDGSATVAHINFPDLLAQNRYNGFRESCLEILDD